MHSIPNVLSAFKILHIKKRFRLQANTKWYILISFFAGRVFKTYYKYSPYVRQAFYKCVKMHVHWPYASVYTIYDNYYHRNFSFSCVISLLVVHVQRKLSDLMK